MNGRRTPGHIPIAIDVTPDHLHQSHRFFDPVDQTYLPGLIGTINRGATRWPPRQWLMLGRSGMQSRNAGQLRAQWRAAVLERSRPLLAPSATQRR